MRKASVGLALGINERAGDVKLRVPSEARHIYKNVINGQWVETGDQRLSNEASSWLTMIAARASRATPV